MRNTRPGPFGPYGTGPCGVLICVGLLVGSTSCSPQRSGTVSQTDFTDRLMRDERVRWHGSGADIDADGDGEYNVAVMVLTELSHGKRLALATRFYVIAAESPVAGLGPTGH